MKAKVLKVNSHVTDPPTLRVTYQPKPCDKLFLRLPRLGANLKCFGFRLFSVNEP